MSSRASWAAALVAALLCASAASAGTDRVQTRVLETRPGGLVLIGAGAKAGVDPRTVFDVYEPARVVKLPLTDEVAYVPERVVARLVVVAVEAGTSVARVVALEPGKKPPALGRGDLVVSNPFAPAVNVAPYIKALRASKTKVRFGDRVTLRLEASDENDDRFYFVWKASAGHLSLSRTTRPEVTWLPPATPGRVTIEVQAIDTAGNRASASIRIENEGFRGIERNVYRVRRSVGNQEGLFESCRDVAFDEQGTAYLIDWERERIVGMAEGWRRALTTEPLRRDLELDRAVTRGGYLYAIDRSGMRAVKLRIGPKMLQDKPALSFGGRGVGNARFENPIDIAVDSRGWVYVLDGSEQRPAVHVFDDLGRFAASLGAVGARPGMWMRPTAIALGHDDALYVLDDGRKVVLVYERLRFVREFGVGAASSKLVDAKVDPFSGRLTVLDAATGQLRSYRSDGAALGRPFGKLGRFMHQWNEPARLRYDGKGTLYLISDRGRVLHRLDPVAGAETGRWGGLDLGRTKRIAVSGDGRLAMLIPREALVAVLDGEGWITALFGGEGDAAGKFDTPIDLAFDREGNVAVLDSGKNRIEVFDPRGNPLRVIGKPGRAAAELDDVVGIGASADRRYLLTVQASERYPIKVFDLLGRPRAALPKKSGLDDPVSVCMSGTGRIYAAESGGRLWYFDLGTKRLAGPTYIDRGAGVRSGRWKIGGLDRPTRVVASNIGLLFAVQSADLVQVWDVRRAASLTQIKDPKKLSSPMDVAVDDYDRVYVWDRGKERVVVLAR